MYPRTNVDQDFALGFAQTLARSSESECQEIFADLLRKRQLSHTVHCLNQLLHIKEHSDAARSGLCGLGFPDDIKDVP
jgi:hypothetical protein